MSNDEGKNKVFFTGLLVGGLLGAAAAYVLGTEDKEELKRQLKKKGKLLLDSLDDLGEKAEKAGKKVERKIVKQSVVISKQVKQIPAIAEKTVENIGKVTERAMEDTASAMGNLQEAAGDNIKSTHKTIKKFFFKKGKPLVKKK